MEKRGKGMRNGELRKIERKGGKINIFVFKAAVNFINVKRANFSYERRFGGFF